jgi:peroxiredoxin
MKLCRPSIVFALAALLALAGSDAFAQTDAAKALKVVNDDLKAKSKTMAPYAYVDFAEKSMLDFLKKYPKGPEAAQARFTLGRIYASTGASENAIRHFSDYLAMPGEKGGPEVVAQAKYMLGMSYLALERYDEAERSLREVGKSGSAVDSRIREGASAELARISSLRRLKVGAPALDIRTTSFQGKKIQLLGGYKGKVVLLDFWAAWCNPCRMEMPNVIGVYNEFHKKGFEIIGISLDNEKERFQSFIRDNKMEWPQVFDGKYWMSEYARLYAVNSIPATFLIDKKGIIRFKNVRGEELREKVSQLLDEK